MELLDMTKKTAGRTVGRIVAGAFALLILVTTGAKGQSPTDLRQKYSKMAPIEEYLMDRNAEIALARSAGPDSISKDATVLVLTRHGWETAVEGTNGFVCNVERGWTGSIDFPEVWNPKIRGADCLNPGAVRSILPIEYKLTQMTLAGVYSDEDRLTGLQAAYAKKEIPPLEPGAMGYMMAKGSYLGDVPPTNFFSHLMFFVGTRKGDPEWGGWLPHVPLGTSSYWFPQPGHETPLDQKLPAMRVFYILVPRWSDGTSILAK